MVGQRLTAVLALRACLGRRLFVTGRRLGLLLVCGLRDLIVFRQVERQLVYALRLRPEPRLAMAVKFGLQLLDLVGLRLDVPGHLLADRAQLIGVFGQGFEGVQHG